jgi:hypothetical protein
MSDWNGNDWVVSAPPASKPESRVKRLAAATLEAGLITALTFGLIAGSVFAAKGGGGTKHGGGGTGTGGGTVAMVLSTDVNSNGSVNWGDTITYTVSTTATAYPYVSTQCTQSGVLVLSGSAGWYDSYAWPSARFVPLATDRWTGGAASCTARLYSMDGGSQSVLQTITFGVGA